MEECQSYNILKVSGRDLSSYYYSICLEGLRTNIRIADSPGQDSSLERYSYVIPVDQPEKTEKENFAPVPLRPMTNFMLSQRTELDLWVRSQHLTALNVAQPTTGL